MTDKILTEAFAKLKALEEADDYVPLTPEERDKERRMRDARNRSGEEDSSAIGYPGENNELEEDSGEDLMDGIEELTEIQDQMFELIERLDSAIRAYAPRSHSYWQSYGLAQLKIVAGSDEYASHDKSINSLIQDLTDEASDADDHFDDEDDLGVGRR